MYYLSACNSELFKSCYCCFIFAIRKILQNSLLSNIRNKCVKIKIKFFFLFSFLSFFFLFFFDVMKNGQIFPSNACHFQYDHRFLFSREMGNIKTCKKMRLQKFVKFRLSWNYYSLWHLSSCS